MAGPSLQFEGFVIVSADGMLGNPDRTMPDALKYEGDYRFFSTSLDRMDLIVHGRNSFEDQPNSPKRRRLILTRAIASIAPDPDNPNATLWNPQGATFEQACAAAKVTSGSVAIIGGPVVFDMFMDRYDTFWLSTAPRVRLPGHVGVFGDVPARSPQDILASHGLKPEAPVILDPAHDVTVTPWRRS